MIFFFFFCLQCYVFFWVGGCFLCFWSCIIMRPDIFFHAKNVFKILKLDFSWCFKIRFSLFVGWNLIQLGIGVETPNLINLFLYSNKVKSRFLNETWLSTTSFVEYLEIKHFLGENQWNSFPLTLLWLFSLTGCQPRIQNPVFHIAGVENRYICASSQGLFCKRKTNCLSWNLNLVSQFHFCLY